MIPTRFMRGSLSGTSDAAPLARRLAPQRAEPLTAGGPESFSRTFRQQLARFRRNQPADQQIPAIHFRSLRHTHAVWQLKAGVHPRVVQERLGHETIGTTMDIHSHVMPSMGKEAVSQHGAMLYSKGS
jgi:integrase